MRVILAFGSRTQALRCSSILDGNGVKNRVINTPQQLGIGCGLSIEFDSSCIRAINIVLERFRFSEIKGFFTLKNGVYVKI